MNPQTIRGGSMDDLATHYLSLMEDPRPFRYFLIEDALKAVPWPLEESLTRVPSQFCPSGHLNRYGILYLALLGCLPFRGLPDQTIRDVRKRPPRRIFQHMCMYRDPLLINMTSSLLLYERGCEMDDDWPALYQSLRLGLLQIRPFVIILLNLKQRGRRPTDPTLRGKANRYQRYFNELTDAIPRLTHTDYYHGREPLPGSSLTTIR